MASNKEEKQTGGFQHFDEMELHHTDKLFGLFLNPSATFSRISKERLKNTDWIIPLLLLIIISNLATIVMMSDPDIKFQMIENMIASSREQLDDSVASGKITREQADQRIENIRNKMEGDISAMMMSQVIGIAVFTFVIFFFISGLYFIISKYGFKGNGTYKSALVGYGLPFYIIVLQAIVQVVIAFSIGKIVQDTSVATFIDADRTTFAGFLLSKLDIFSIWFYSIVSIAYAKLFKSNVKWKYFAMIFGLWLGFSIILYFTDSEIPHLIEFIGDIFK